MDCDSGAKTENGVVQNDNRGRHKRNITPQIQVIVDSIHEDIMSFPKIESHYVRKHSKKEYLSGDLTMSEMFDYTESGSSKNTESTLKVQKKERPSYFQNGIQP